MMDSCLRLFLMGRTETASFAMICSSSVGSTSTVTRLGRADETGIGVVRLRDRVRRQASETLTDRCANLRLVFADAGGEHEAIQAAERGREPRSSPAIRNANSSSASRASGRSLASSSRLSALIPETPSKPDCSYSIFSTSLALRPCCFKQMSTTPASSAPQRVAIGMPSSVEKPMLVSRLLPPRTRTGSRRCPDARRSPCRKRVWGIVSQACGDELIR